MMGCHTWFSRPITEKEFALMKEYAPIEIFNLVGDSVENVQKGMYDECLYKMLMKSYNEEVPCVCGKFWWQLGYGSSNPELLHGENNYVHEVRGCNGLFVAMEEYLDVFRVKGYPRKIIHSRRELRKWMRKRYFQLEEWQLVKISEFFKENPGGVIHFG